MSYTATLTITIVPAIGNAEATDLDGTELVKLVIAKIVELDHSSRGSAMAEVVLEVPEP